MTTNDFFPCYYDIDKHYPSIMFGWKNTDYENNNILAKEDFIKYLMEKSEVKSLFPDDMYRKIADIFFTDYSFIKYFYIWAKWYIYDRKPDTRPILPSTKYLSDDKIIYQWRQKVFQAYEKYRTAPSIFDRIVYEQILNDLLWNAKVDPFNPMIQELNKKMIEDRLSNLGNNHMNEASIKDELDKYKIDIDEDGNILIKKNFQADLMKYYNNSLRMMRNYKNSNNITGLKSELAKMFFINELIEMKYIYNEHITQDDKKDYRKYVALRANLLSSFKTYMEYLLSIEPDFNFNDYYENSKYATVLTVKQSHIRGIRNLFRALFF